MVVMTIDKKEVITLPKWLVILVLPMLISAIITYGGLSGTKATLQTKALRNEQEIQRLYDQKCDRNEFNKLYDIMIRVENKVDKHIDE